MLHDVEMHKNLTAMARARARVLVVVLLMGARVGRRQNKINHIFPWNFGD